ncbi:MAG TPA: hypothetical protein VMB34_20750 [Acetobacteraceae bacterium]|nr:hypothetical protein [Acetobacteraceae bacterium]
MPPDNETDPDGTGNKSDRQAAPNHPVAVAVNAFAEAYESKHNSATSRDHQILKWTRRTAIIAGIYAFLTLVIAGASVWGAYESRVAADAAATAAGTAAKQLTELQRQTGEAKRQADAALEQADTARDELVIANRPWLSFDMRIAADVVFKEGAYQVKLDYTITNEGRSPAVNFTLLLVPYFDTGNPADASVFQKQLCSHEVKSNVPTSNILFAGKDYLNHFSASISPYQIEQGERRFEKSQNRSVGSVSVAYLALIGCVNYKFASDPSGARHQTMLWYYVNIGDGLRQGVAVYPKDTVSLTKWVDGNGAD